MGKEFPRQYVPEEVNLGDWNQIEPLFQSLLQREITSLDQFEQWLLDTSELASCLSEERTRRYIAMTCHTDDQECEKRYLEFIETIDPRSKPYWHQLNQAYLNSPYRISLSSDRYQVLDRNVKASVEIFREENIPLQTDAAKLSQRYQKLCGAMMVMFDGKEHTLPQMGKYLEETDRSHRQRAWEATAKRRLQDRDEMDDIFDQLISIRQKVSRNTGFSNFVDYAFLMYQRFDYTPEDCERFHHAIEACVVPLMRRMGEKRRKQLNLEQLRPWDLAVDPLERDPLRPFDKTEELSRGVNRIFQHLDSELAQQFKEMEAQSELDMESRKGKAPGGYLTSLDEIRRPFIFMNAAGLQRDVETLLHESGHAFHMLAARHEPLIEYRDSPIEFAEVASMSMELFGADYFHEFYSAAEAARAQRVLYEGIIKILPWIARIDAFQHWIYKHPTHSREERTTYWRSLEERFGQAMDWSGYEAVRDSYWQKQLHLFCHPLYYFEYGVAQLGALQLWRNYKKEPKETLKRYRQALALGGSRPLPELFQSAGAEFKFDEETIQPLMTAIEDELNQLPE